MESEDLLESLVPGDRLELDGDSSRDSGLKHHVEATDAGDRAQDLGDVGVLDTKADRIAEVLLPASHVLHAEGDLILLVVQEGHGCAPVDGFDLELGLGLGFGGRFLGGLGKLLHGLDDRLRKLGLGRRGRRGRPRRWRLGLGLGLELGELLDGDRGAQIIRKLGGRWRGESATVVLYLGDRIFLGKLDEGDLRDRSVLLEGVLRGRELDSRRVVLQRGEGGARGLDDR